ncbi:MAG: hypothetical protein IH945_05585 [Armatimonadetes bacterium]|nr:hypothetical protein [Armatimonadota bacterium]
MPIEAAPFLNWGMAVSLVMAIIWLFRLKSKRWRAVAMTGAFVAFAALLWFLREGASQGMIVGAGVVLFVLLAADGLMRTAEKAPEDSDEHHLP